MSIRLDGSRAGLGAVAIRDRRIDFIRGVALLTIYTDHLRRNALAKYTLYSVGFADMAEVFVFLSGYVAGMVYARTLAGSGFVACQSKANVRCLQLYLAHVVSIVTLAAAIGLWQMCSGQHELGSDFAWHSELMSQPLAALAELVSLQLQPRYFCILPMYIVFLPILPLILIGCRRHVTLVLTVSVAMYTCVQFWPTILTLSSQPARAWYFNPLAWQILYVVGAVFGSRPDIRRLVPGGILLLCIAIAGLESSLILECWMPRSSIPFIRKPDLGPVRLLYFACLLEVSRFIPDCSHPIWQSRFVQPIVTCGANSLVVFCAGIVLANLVNLALPVVGYGTLIQFVINIGGWLTLWLAAVIRTNVRWKTPRLTTGAELEHAGT